MSRSSHHTPSHFPRIPEEVALFVAHLGQQGLAIFTIEVYLSGLHYVSLLANPSEASPSLHSPFLKLLLHGSQCGQETSRSPPPYY